MPVSRKPIMAVILIASALVSMSSIALSSSNPLIQSYGSINYTPKVTVTVNLDEITGSNNLSLGFMLDWERWVDFMNNPVLRQQAQNAGFKLIRIFDFRPTTPSLMPLTYWNETTKTGTWNWTNVDTLVQTIFEVGAEPLFCLGYARDNIQNYIPPGMAVDRNTSLPYPEDYSIYATEWVKHFLSTKMPVRYYQIMNEPYFYFGWNAANMTKLANYVRLWNAVAKSMRATNPGLRLSQDSITMRNVFDYWLKKGENVDFLDFHKYDAGTVDQYNDTVMFGRAETYMFENSGSFYGVVDARRMWYNARQKWIPIINSESNFNSAWQNGTDPKIQQMGGAVWLALVLRMAILKGLNYNVYFELCSRKSWQQHLGTGWGFGMINEDNDQPWLPYLVQELIGGNLSTGDNLVRTSCSSEDIRTLGWIHDGKLNVLVVSKTIENRSLTFEGVSGTFKIRYVDSTVAYDSPGLQSASVLSSQLFLTHGYTVALLQLSG